MSIASARKLSRIRIQKLQLLKEAIMDKEQEIEREIMLSQGSSNVSLSQDSETANVNGELTVAHRQVHSTKRRMDFSSEDEGSSLTKYRRLTTEEKILKLKDDKNSDTSSTLSYDSSDESSNAEDRTRKEVLPNKDNVAENSCISDDCNYENTNSGSVSEMQQYCKKSMDTESESEAESLRISPQKDLPSNEILDKIDKKESIKVLEKYVAASTAAKIHNHVIYTSQFSSTEDCGNDKTNSVDHLDESLKQSDSDLYENTEEQIVETELPSSSNEIVVPENSNTKTNVNGDEEQEAVIQNLLNNAQFAIITETAGENKNFVLKKNNSIVVGSQIVSETVIPDNGQIFSVQGDSSNVYLSEHADQVPSTSGAAEEQSNAEASRANSVSDLNLAQLVLSLKEDIQELTRKIEKQESILGAVVQANEINLAPLFAQSFHEKHNLILPFSKIEDFDKFNQDLAKDTKFCNEFITSLCSYIDNNVTLAKNILTMLRKYMSKDLAMLFTASKATGNKLVLKDTLFCKCLLQATKLTIRNGLLPLEHEKAFMKNLGLVISGAKGWHIPDEERRNDNSQ